MNPGANKFLALATLVLAWTALPAHAYLDPASGSMFLQLLLGGVAGVALLVKLYWFKLLHFLGIRKEDDGEQPPA